MLWVCRYVIYSADGNCDFEICDVCKHTHTHGEKIYIILVCKNTVCALCTQYTYTQYSIQRECVYTDGKYIYTV